MTTIELLAAAAFRRPRLQSIPHLWTVSRRAMFIAAAWRAFLTRLRELAADHIEYDATNKRKARACRGCHHIVDGFHRCPNRVWTHCMDCGGRKRLLDVYGRYCPAGHEPRGRRHLRTTRGDARG